MDRQVRDQDQPIDILFKLIPAELTAAYLALRSTVSVETSTDSDAYLLVFWAVVLLIASPFFLRYVLQISNRAQRIILTLSLAIWIANIENARIADYRGDWLSWLSSHSLGVAGGVLRVSFFNSIFLQGVLILWVLMIVPIVSKRLSLA